MAINKKSSRHAAQSCKSGEKQRVAFQPSRQKRSLDSGLNNSNWQLSSQLFSDLSENFLQALELLPDAIAKVWHIPASKRKELPEDIARLSRILTSGRSELALPYWHKAANISAYLYYFLPWNIIRMGKLFNSLPLAEPKELTGKHPILLDIGSGPLALPIALWLAKKNWRHLPLQVLAVDSSSQALELGKKIFYVLADLLGERAWHVSSYKGSAERPMLALQNFYEKAGEDKYYPWLLAEANILNELLSKASSQNEKFNSEGDQDEDEDFECENSVLGRLLKLWLPIWQSKDAQSSALFIEPGTRLGGDAIMNLRRCALRLGFKTSSPCTHSQECPLLKKGRRNGSYAESWCHFTFSACGAPQWLRELSLQAGLEKSSLSLSFLLLAEKAERTYPQNASRVISQNFKVPGLKGEARYGCGAWGLELLEDTSNLSSGSLTFVQKKSDSQRDKKSGALICQAGWPNNNR